jgi:hypothetical protein
MRWSLLLLLAWFVVPLTTLAQEPPPRALFPSTDDLGPDWLQQSVFDVPLTEYPYFDRFAAAIYMGPRGSRILIGYTQVAEGATATRQAWEEMVGAVSIYSQSMTVDYTGQTDLDTVPPVVGCNDMRRVEGTDRVFAAAVPVGISLCAVDPDVLILTYVSGNVAGYEGYEASDLMIEMMLETAV